MVPAVGMLCLGFVMAYVSMYFVARLTMDTATGVVGIIGILLGVIVARWLADNTHAGVDTVWWYPIGLFIGLATWIALRYVGRGGTPEPDSVDENESTT
jgi:Na+-transporting methylmalonyl-CoA/oxaloacetate decarboxylase beta subunit